ncbi:alpha/beta fold hydrolase [Erythrobacter ani]|uniref:Alpha/beta hydrolase n=1 Tax=Erythrobacter ani TaxID=2827235 RepID=A0ABS6SL46_9SPHN|nr:alpha/beta hydrolase [Erythrobacter ani]MBV7265222.1 alpha/beta hydrolase [Erythrobacter ani]
MRTSGVDRSVVAATGRRAFLMSAAGAISAAALTGGATNPLASATLRKRDIVLVHGAWHGGWCWEMVRALLEPDGHRVFTPTLPGLAERAGELTPQIGLDTHIDDVVATILAEDLTDFVLCGHSYGGMVITGVADRLKERVAHIVYLDAALPKDGESMLSYGEPRPQAAIDGATAAMRGLAPDGLAIGVFPPSVLGIPAGHPRHDWVAERLTPHPLKTWLDPIKLANGGPEGLAQTYIHCTDPVMAQTQFPWIASQVSNDPSWNYAELKTGHDAMVTDPEGVAQILRTAARTETLREEGA